MNKTCSLCGRDRCEHLNGCPRFDSPNYVTRPADPTGHLPAATPRSWFRRARRTAPPVDAGLLSRLPAAATGTVLTSGGAGVAPAWSPLHDKTHTRTALSVKPDAVLFVRTVETPAGDFRTELVASHEGREGGLYVF